MEDELKELLQRIGLGPEAIRTRMRFLEWQPSDGARLNSAAADLDDAQARFIERLYTHMAAFDTPTAMLADPQRLVRLKLEGNLLRAVPPPVLELRGLRELGLGCNRLSGLPDAIDQVSRHPPACSSSTPTPPPASLQ